MRNFLTYPYWYYTYHRYCVKKDIVSLADFRTLLTVVRRLAREESHKEWARHLYYLPLQIMGPLVDLTQSRTLENLRLRYGKYFNLVLFRQYLDFTGHGDNKGVVVRVKDIERASGMVFLTIYHHSQKKDNIPSFLTTALHTYYQVPKNQIHVTTIDPHHFKIVFPSSS